MRRTGTAPATTSPSLRPIAVGLIVVSAVIIGTFGHRAAPSSASSSIDTRPPVTHDAVPPSAPSLPDLPRSDHDGATTGADGVVTEEDGALPDGVTVRNDGYPGVANLDPDLSRALRDAATDAADDGVELTINSGWRSAEYQDRLLREAISEYGSEKAAARWVAPADRSAHVSGDAIDIGSFDATAWLSRHGATYGLCQIYGNELWHYELRPTAIDRGCPPMVADPAHDPTGQP